VLEETRLETWFGETGLKIRPDVIRHDNCERINLTACGEGQTARRFKRKFCSSSGERFLPYVSTRMRKIPVPELGGFLAIFSEF
jgi:hypothetical protein